MRIGESLRNLALLDFSSVLTDAVDRHNLDHFIHLLLALDRGKFVVVQCAPTFNFVHH